MNLNPSIAHHLTPSPTLHINEQVRARWAAGETVYHFGFGESRFSVHPRLQAALAANAHRKAYPPVQGVPELREAIAAHDSRWLGISCAAEQIIVGPGSKSLIYILQMALAGDLILPIPSWVSYAPQANLLGKPVHFVSAAAEDGYQMTIENLDAVVQGISTGQKLLILNTPSNPTGQMLTAELLIELADYCRAHQVFIISDEIYGEVPHGLQPHLSPSRFYPEGTIVVGGMSKHLSLGGWRLGRAIIPEALSEKLMPALLSIASEIWSSPSAPIQYAALTAYVGDSEVQAYVEKCTAIHAARTQHIWSWLDEIGIQVAQPQGGFYMMPNFNRWREPLAEIGVHTSEDLAGHLLDKYQLAFLPGTAFGTDPADLSLRLATSFIDMETTEAADRILDAWHGSKNPEAFMEDHHPQTAAALRQLQRFISSVKGSL
ncbi:MAG: aminotransferase class I/II-fold pyridoxal phosphate-dependent enzyme [Ardenticatenaceae bacterium]|nr:aminotransferase class I/II-fold pyridoxal phosphate-dependent enzyme [Ardenticatenaceae bacterium]